MPRRGSWAVYLPGGQRIAFAGRSDVYIFNRLTGDVLDIGPGTQPQPWAPNAVCYIQVRETDVNIVKASGPNWIPSVLATVPPFNAWGAASKHRATFTVGPRDGSTHRPGPIVWDGQQVAESRGALTVAANGWMAYISEDETVVVTAQNGQEVSRRPIAPHWGLRIDGTGNVAWAGSGGVAGYVAGALEPTGLQVAPWPKEGTPALFHDDEGELWVVTPIEPPDRPGTWLLTRPWGAEDAILTSLEAQSGIRSLDVLGGPNKAFVVWSDPMGNWDEVAIDLTAPRERLLPGGEMPTPFREWSDLGARFNEVWKETRGQPIHWHACLAHVHGVIEVGHTPEFREQLIRDNAPQPEPEPEPPPPAPSLPPVDFHRGDMLTLEDDQTGEMLAPTLYLGYNEHRRRRVRNNYFRQRYSHLYFGVIQEFEAHLPPGHPQFDHLDDPDVVASACRELHELGIWPILILGMEDAPAAQAKYRQPDEFDRRLRALIPAVNLWVGEYILGVEVEEWSDYDHVLRYAKTIRAHSPKRIGVHFHGGRRGWPGREEDFWRDLRRDVGGAIALPYQSGFDFQEANDMSGLVTDARSAQQWAEALGIQFYVLEYAHPKKSPAPWRGAGAALEMAGMGWGNGR